MNQTRWFVKLRGSEHDLRRLSELDVDGWEIVVDEADGGYALTSPDFVGLVDLHEVGAKASEVALAVMGAARLYFRTFTRLRVGEAYGVRPNGTRRQRVYSALSNVTSATTASNDVVEPLAAGDPPAGIYAITLAVGLDPKVQGVLRDYQKHDVWTLRRRRVYDAIRKDVDPFDKRALRTIGWVPQCQHDRFWNTIHNEGATDVGYDALHIGPGDPNGAQPMTRAETDDFIRELVIRWIRWIYGGRHRGS